MNKHLVKSEEEYVKLFEDFSLNDAEDFLGVEFALPDGRFYSDVGDDDRDGSLAAQECSRTVYRKNSEDQFPVGYPCVVLLENEKK